MTTPPLLGDEAGGVADSTSPPEESPSVVASRAARLLGGAETVDEQLRRLESRLVEEAGGDPARADDIRRHVLIARSRFEAATVQRYLPILVERAVRRQLRER